jgi:putative PIN family toxin of toxin-antitoxin system
VKVVLDCNVVIAAARTDGVCRTVLLDVVRRHQLVLSAPIIEEYRSVGARPKHKRYHRTMSAMTDLLEQVALIFEPAEGSFGLDDPDDEIYLATAFAAQAETLITGNLRHFPAPRYGSIEILGPADFLARHGPSR